MIQGGGTGNKRPVKIQAIIFAIVASTLSAQIELGRTVANYLSVIECAINNPYGFSAQDLMLEPIIIAVGQVEV